MNDDAEGAPVSTHLRRRPTWGTRNFRSDLRRRRLSLLICFCVCVCVCVSADSWDLRQRRVGQSWCSAFRKVGGRQRFTCRLTRPDGAIQLARLNSDPSPHLALWLSATDLLVESDSVDADRVPSAINSDPALEPLNQRRRLASLAPHECAILGSTPR